MSILPFGRLADIQRSALTMSMLGVFVGVVYVVIATFHEDGRPDQPLLRCSELRAVGGLQDMVPYFYMPPTAYNRHVAGYARSFVGIAGTAAIIAAAFAAIALLTKKNRA